MWKLPVWLFLLCLLLGALFTVGFSWVVKDTVSGSDRFGSFGTAALAVASFPDLVRASFREIEVDADARFRVPRTSVDLAEFEPARTRPGIDVRGLMVRADRNALARAAGWRVLIGGFTINGELNQAALVLSPDLEIVKTWILTEEDEIGGIKSEPTAGKLVHGFAILDDGSIAFAFDVGISLQRFDRCGKRMWSTGGYFDHAVTPDDTGDFLWSLRKEQINDDWLDQVVQVAAATGEVLRVISMDDIIAANPDLHILDIREADPNWGNGNPRTLPPKRLDDPFHLNDVEPLPASIADRFPQFRAGDLLLSARSLNLVFVVDPATLQIKWWRTGAWRRQHDPDWEPTGEITVYDNRMDRSYSQILGIDPVSGDLRVILDGRVNDFYSRIRGKHQFTQTGDLLISIPQQGRVLELESSGNVVLEVINTRPGSGEFNYPISEARWFPSDAFDFEKDFSCAK
jgi:hypothetical protein